MNTPTPKQRELLDYAATRPGGSHLHPIEQEALRVTLAQLDSLRIALERIKAWDQLNPTAPMSDLFWLKSLVIDALNGDVT